MSESTSKIVTYTALDAVDMRAAKLVTYVVLDPAIGASKLVTYAALDPVPPSPLGPSGMFFGT